MRSSALIGFRSPQFSEDAAWLPTWLQQQNVEPFDERINRGETPFVQRVKVINFHLRLSSDANSEFLPSPLGDSSQVQRLTLLKQPLGPSVLSEGKINHSNEECSTSFVNCSPNSRPFNGNHIMRHEENVGCCQVDDISVAVELSIAASEALVIHEMMTGLLAKPLPASTVLEAAIQVKQARLDTWKEASQCSSMDIGETCFLSDLDDLAMEDVYENVGLSGVDNPNHDINVSQVKDSFDSENDRHEGNLEHDFGKSLDDFEKQIADEGLRDEIRVEDSSASEISCGNRHEVLPNISTLCLDPMTEDCSTSPPLHCSEQENLQLSALFEVVDYGMSEDDFCEAHVKSSLARTSEVSEKYNTEMDFPPGRFQSRWFGGWTWKEDNKSFARMQHQKTRGIPKPFVGETSYLSESADVAPDENSVLQKQCRGTTLCSRSSIPSEVYCNKADKEILLSQDVMRSSSLSLNDPLCSVVACSFSSENICSTAILKHESGMLSRNCSISKSEYTTDNFQRKSTVIEVVRTEECIVPVTYSELLPAVGLQLTSLRPHSVMFANPGDSLVKENSCHRTFPLETVPKSSMVENPFFNLRETKNFNKAAENGAFTTILGGKEKILTAILDHREEKSILQATSEGLLLNKEKISTPILYHKEENFTVQGASEGLLLKKEPHKVQPNCENKNSTRVRARKCVRFVGTGANNPPEKKCPKQQTALKNCHTSRAFKRLRTTNQCSQSGAQELKWCQTNCFNKNGKRLLFQNMEFLLTGFSNKKEKQYEGLIRKHGGIILSDIPSPNSRGSRSSRFNPHMLPVVLSLKKLQTIKFLYGCAVNAFVLKADWLTDSIVACSILPPQRYSILPRRHGGCSTRIQKPLGYNFHQPTFDNLGIMLHGKNNFCIEM
ncbi:hypothetical protein ACH5RR_023259 [Cinchona calisaya]|uniref:BRCT domain-containing protein n=1 Tax=Cinchona calisaya TaxID=153742 RepID=A0ABD2ZA64_9GENT